MSRFGDFIVSQNKGFFYFFVQQKISKSYPWQTEFFVSVFLDSYNVQAREQ